MPYRRLAPLTVSLWLILESDDALDFLVPLPALFFALLDPDDPPLELPLPEEDPPFELPLPEEEPLPLLELELELDSLDPPLPEDPPLLDMDPPDPPLPEDPPLLDMDPPDPPLPEDPPLLDMDPPDPPFPEDPPLPEDIPPFPEDPPLPDPLPFDDESSSSLSLPLPLEDESSPSSSGLGPTPKDRAASRARDFTPGSARRWRACWTYLFCATTKERQARRKNAKVLVEIVIIIFV